MPEVQAVVEATDEILVSRIRAGDSVAKEELFRRHFGISYRVAHRLLGQEQDAQDAVQDAFVKALRHLNNFDGRSGFLTWLLKIVHNAALDLGRKRKRRTTIPMDDAEAGGPETAIHEDPGLGLQREDLKHALDEALHRLSPLSRSAFVLFAEAGLSYKEIAAVQDVPIGTVMSRIHSARQKLQLLLEGVEGIG